MTSDHSHAHHEHHHDNHNHSHEHDHSHNERSVEQKSLAQSEKDRRHEVLKKLKTATIFCFTFFLIEVIGGILAGSLAVLSDAAHLAADLSAFVVAISGSHIASMPASETHTFGLKRTESLAALFSMVSLAILSIGLAVEAVRRMWIILYVPEEAESVNGKLMSTIAFIGVIVNLILAFVLGEDGHVHMVGADHDHDHSHDHGSKHHCHDEEAAGAPLLSAPHKHYSTTTTDAQHLNEVLPESHHNEHDIIKDAPARNVNLHAAYLHVLADLAQSVVVLIAGLIIWWKPSWQLADPICTLIFSVLVSYSTVGVIKSSLSVLLEEVPPGVDWDEIYDAISGVSGISNVHDLHVWSISHNNYSLSVHATAENVEQAFHDIKKICNKRKITHLTLQVQPTSIADECVSCLEDSVHMCR